MCCSCDAGSGCRFSGRVRCRGRRWPWWWWGGGPAVDMSGASQGGWRRPKARDYKAAFGGRRREGLGRAAERRMSQHESGWARDFSLRLCDCGADAFLAADGRKRQASKQRRCVMHGRPRRMAGPPPPTPIAGSMQHGASSIAHALALLASNPPTHPTPPSTDTMAKSLAGALALALAALPSAHAFRNTSPYFVFSTAACVPTYLPACLPCHAANTTPA